MKIVYTYTSIDGNPPSRVNSIIKYYNAVITDLHDFKDLVSTYKELKQKDIIGLNAMELAEYLSSGLREKHDEISDLVLYIVLLRIDIEVCCKNLLINREAGNIYEMNYFTRALAMHCSDSVKPQADKLLNRLNNIVKQYIDQPDYNDPRTALITKKNELGTIGKSNIETLDNLRNNLFAHRDGKGIDQHKILNQIKEENVALIADEINTILSDIIGHLLGIQSILTPIKQS